MSEARKPAFMQHATPIPRASAPNVRLATWTAAPLDPALAPKPSVPPTPPPAPSAPMSASFEPLPPAPPPTPAPPPPPVVIDHTPRLQAAIDTLKLEAQRLAEQARSDALEIGVLIARRIIERELASSLDPLFGLIRSAVRRVGEARQIVVKVSAEDHRRLQDSPGSSLSLGTVTLQADDSLGPGDVVVESELHGVDGRLETRLEELRRELRAAMQET